MRKGFREVAVDALSNGWHHGHMRNKERSPMYPIFRLIKDTVLASRMERLPITGLHVSQPHLLALGSGHVDGAEQRPHHDAV